MSGRLRDFLGPESLAAFEIAQHHAAKPRPAPPRLAADAITAGPGRVLVELELPDVDPIFGSDCPRCRYVLYLKLVLWPPGTKPKDAPAEAWWCGRCERYYVYQEIGDAEETGEQGGRAEAPLSPVRRADGGNGSVQRVL